MISITNLSAILGCPLYHSQNYAAVEAHFGQDQVLLLPYSEVSTPDFNALKATADQVEMFRGNKPSPIWC